MKMERASPGLIARAVKPRQVGGRGEYLQLIARQRRALIRPRKRGISTRPRLPLEQLQAFANLVQMGHPYPRKPSNAKACNTPTHPGGQGD